MVLRTRAKLRGLRRLLEDGQGWTLEMWERGGRREGVGGVCAAAGAHVLGSRRWRRGACCAREIATAGKLGSDSGERGQGFRGWSGLPGKWRGRDRKGNRENVRQRGGGGGARSPTSKTPSRLRGSLRTHSSGYNIG